jgi:PleD family two-component response regulator
VQTLPRKKQVTLFKWYFKDLESYRKCARIRKAKRNDTIVDIYLSKGLTIKETASMCGVSLQLAKRVTKCAWNSKLKFTLEQNKANEKVRSAQIEVRRYVKAKVDSRRELLNAPVLLQGMSANVREYFTLGNLR